jgi:WD40 repeat protein
MTLEVAQEPAPTKARAYENPYVGLRPFMREDSRLFFGRREQTIALLALLRESRFLPVVGSSGSGKSSLVRAGLVPALLGGFLVQDRDRWLVATMKPGDAPFTNLAQALIDVADTDEAASTSAAALAEQIGADPFDAVSSAIAERVGDRKNLLLIVDQFEEIFAFRGDADSDTSALTGEQSRALHARLTRRAEADEFVSLLLELSQALELPVYVVITMRSDFAGDCDLFRGLPEAMNRTRYLVPRLRREQLREAIEGPALLENVKLAPRLLDRLLNELGDRADQLPIMQHALLQTWERWRASPSSAGAVIEQRDYESAGTLDAALARHADELLDAVDPRLVELLFKRLADTDLRGRRVRRAASFGDLRELAEASRFSEQDVERALESFQASGRHFVSVATAGASDERRVDISHESLIRQWPALRAWVDQERAARDELRALLAEHDRHERSGRTAPTLLQEADLAVAEHWLAQHRPNATWASRYAAGGAFEAVVAYVARSKQQRARAERARTRTFIAVFAALLALALAAAGFGAYAWRESQKSAAAERVAIEAERRAKASRAAAESQLAENLFAQGRDALRAGDTEQAARALAESYQLNPESQNTRLLLPHAIALGPELLAAVLAASSDRAPVQRAAFSPNGSRVVTASGDHSARLWEVPSGRLVAQLSGHQDFVNDAVFSPDGALIFTASSDKSLRVWDASTGKPISTLLSGELIYGLAFQGADALAISAAEGARARVWQLTRSPDGAVNAALRAQLKGPSASLTSATFSADAARIVTTSADHTAGLWDAASGALLMKLNAPTGMTFSAVALSRDGALLATSTIAREDGGAPAEQATAVRIWSEETGALQHVLIGHDAAVDAIAFSSDPSSKLIVTASRDHTARVWDESGALLATLVGHEDQVGGARLSADGERVVTFSRDETARLWYARSGTPIAVLTGHADKVSDASFSPDGRYLATVSDDATARLWNTGASLAATILRGHTGPVNAASFSADGTRVVTGSQDNTARLWDERSGAQLFQLDHGAPVNAASFSADGKMVVTASADGSAAAWSLAAGTRPIRMQHDAAVNAATFSADGSRIATASDDTTAAVWDASTGKQLQVFRHDDKAVRSATFSPDQRLVLTRTADGTISLWDVSSGKRLITNGGELVDVIAWSPDGKTIVTGAYEATTFWDAPEWKPRPKHDDGEVSALSFDPSGGRVAVAKGTWVRVLDARSVAAVLELKGAHSNSIRSLGYSADGAWIFTASDDGTACIWDVATGRLLVRLEGHAAPIRAASMTREGGRLVTASDDMTVRLWDLRLEARSPAEILELVERNNDNN